MYFLVRAVFFLSLSVFYISAFGAKAQCIVPSYNMDKDISHNVLINIYSQLILLNGQKNENSFCLQNKYDFGKEFIMELVPQNQTLDSWKEYIGLRAIRAPVLPIQKDIIPEGYALKSLMNKSKRTCHFQCQNNCSTKIIKESKYNIEFLLLCGKNFKQFQGNAGVLEYYKLFKKGADNFMLYYKEKVITFDASTKKINADTIAKWNDLIDTNIRFLSPHDNETILYGDMVLNREDIRKNKEAKINTHIVLGSKINRKEDL